MLTGGIAFVCCDIKREVWFGVTDRSEASIERVYFTNNNWHIFKLSFGGGGGGGGDYLHAHAHHEIKDWLSGPGSRGRLSFFKM